MSTRGSIEWDGDSIPTPDWSGEPICDYCLCRRCGCPHEPTIPANVVLGED